MGEIKVAICDDEQNIRDYLAGLIRREDMPCEISEYASAEAYLAAEESPDLLFLDIGLSGAPVSAADGLPSGTGSAVAATADISSMDGMALARHLRSLPQDRQPLVIFVTGYEDYVYQAFDVEAFQYLVKPVEERRFSEIFRRAAEKLSLREKQRRKTLLIQHAGVSRIIPLDNICYAESQGHKVRLHLKEGTLEYYERIGYLERQLGEQFARIHKGYLVNLAYVEEYCRGEITLKNGEKLMISKYKYDEFVKQHLRFLQQ